MKKIILFLILSLALVLTACGKSSDSNNDTSKKIDNKDIVILIMSILQVKILILS